MKYLIVSSSLNLDCIISMYLYCRFIENAGFDVKCYIEDEKINELEKIMKENSIDLSITNIIDKESNIIILNNRNFNLLENIDTNMVTEIISLKNNNFTYFNDANILIADVKLLSTIIIERYREYKLGIDDKICILLISLYSTHSSITDRDKIAMDYIKILYKSRRDYKL